MPHSAIPHGGINEPEVLSLPTSPECSSDGDRSTWPTSGIWRHVDDWLYRHKLAMMWMEKDGKAVKGSILLESAYIIVISSLPRLTRTGKLYILKQLPDQYSLMDRPRFNDNTIVSAFPLYFCVLLISYSEINSSMDIPQGLLSILPKTSFLISTG